MVPDFFTWLKMRESAIPSELQQTHFKIPPFQEPISTKERLPGENPSIRSHDVLAPPEGTPSASHTYGEPGSHWWNLFINWFDDFRMPWSEVEAAAKADPKVQDELDRIYNDMITRRTPHEGTNMGRIANRLQWIIRRSKRRLDRIAGNAPTTPYISFGGSQPAAQQPDLSVEPNVFDD